MAVCELRARFFVSSQYVNLVVVLLCDDALHRLESLHAINAFEAESRARISSVKLAVT